MGRQEELPRRRNAAIMVLLLASIMVVVPSTDVSAATGNHFLGQYQSGRDGNSPCAD